MKRAVGHLGRAFTGAMVFGGVIAGLFALVFGVLEVHSLITSGSVPGQWVTSAFVIVVFASWIGAFVGVAGFGITFVQSLVFSWSSGLQPFARLGAAFLSGVLPSVVLTIWVAQISELEWLVPVGLIVVAPLCAATTIVVSRERADSRACGIIGPAVSG